MGLLKQITTGLSPAPRRVMLYGTQGIGKSTFAAQADKPIFIQTEDGLGDIDCAKFPKSTTYEEVIVAIGELFVEKHPYRTVVIDSLDWLERLIHSRVCQDEHVDNIEEIGYGRGYSFALSYWREILEGLSALRGTKGMTVLLVAHSKIVKFQNPATDSYDRYMPALHKAVAAMVQEWCDEVLFAIYQVHTVETKESFDQKRTKAIGNSQRIMYCTEGPTHMAKNRIGLPDELPFEWQAYHKYVTGAAKKKSTK